MEKAALPGLHTEAGLLFLWHYLVAHPYAGPELPAIDDNAAGFLAYCVKNLARSKACYLQDLYVGHKLRDAREGYFVEFGATDGVFLSNTYYLEKELAWDGILAEPLPAWNRQLLSNRSASIDNRCVWRESGKTLEFQVAGRHPELSAIKGYGETDSHAEARGVDAQFISVETVSLNDLLETYDAPRTIDYLSVDTEGSELEILSAFDFERFQVRIITVEHNYTAARELIRELLESRGFVREFTSFSKEDDWYFHPGRL